MKSSVHSSAFASSGDRRAGRAKRSPYVSFSTATVSPSSWAYSA